MTSLDSFRSIVAEIIGVTSAEVIANETDQHMIRIAVTGVEDGLLPFDNALTSRAVLWISVNVPAGILCRFSFGPTWKYGPSRTTPLGQMTIAELDELSVECDRLLQIGELTLGDSYPVWIGMIRWRRAACEWTSLDIFDRGRVIPSRDLETGRPVALPFATSDNPDAGRR